jgi:glycosyltransferase involved in cell wall biosynthesis
MTAPLSNWPTVDVIIPTRDRAHLVREAVRSVAAQDYPGHVRVIVDDDGMSPIGMIPSEGVAVCVVRNSHRGGLSGARNTGIDHAEADLVAFLDDDDLWLPNKLLRQVVALQQDPHTEMVTTSVSVEFAGRSTSRLAGTTAVTHDMLLESRLAMLHSSTFVIRRAALAELGGLDETAPDGHNEDYDLLLRLAARAPILHVDEPLVRVRWIVSSQFRNAWAARLAGAEWVLERHPDICGNAVGHARVLGQIAFAHAALGSRRSALRTASRAWRRRWREPRAYLAVLVVAGVPPSFIMSRLHRYGRGV